MSQEYNTLNRLIHLSGRLLDQEDFKNYVALFSEGGEYRLTARAPEVAQPMTWILLKRDEMDALLASAPKQEWNTGERCHLITVEEINVDGAAAGSRASFCVFRTDLRGATETYAVGHYEDQWQAESGQWRLLKRVARLQTRMLAPPSAIPI
jgi:3-phenylpropionate/cinnamic acid dioxygenase small subunit